MRSLPHIVAVDHSSDTRQLLVSYVRQKIPDAILTETESLLDAARVLLEPIDVLVVHRTKDRDCVALIRALYKMNPGIPIVAVGLKDASQEALMAGATEFVEANMCFLLGEAVERAWSKKAAAEEL